MQVPRLFADFFAREPFGVQKRLLTFWHLFGVFLASFCRSKKVRTSKSRRGNFGRQKVAVEKRQQKVLALAFSFIKMTLYFPLLLLPGLLGQHITKNMINYRFLTKGPTFFPRFIYQSRCKIMFFQALELNVFLFRISVISVK